MKHELMHNRQIKALPLSINIDPNSYFYISQFMANDVNLDPSILAMTQCTVLDYYGEEIPLHHLWKEQTAILVFIRHYACIECRTIAKDVWAQREKFEKSGGKIHFYQYRSTTVHGSI